MADKALSQSGLNLNAEEDVNLVEDHPPKRRRHTRHQIQKLEAFFKDYPNPDYMQRNALSLELGLEPQQVKYWFQNKRTQLKAQNGYLENTELQAENKRLKAENTSLMEHAQNAACIACGSHVIIREMSNTERQLRAGNVQLRLEIDRVSAIVAQYVGMHITDSSDAPQ